MSKQVLIGDNLSLLEEILEQNSSDNSNDNIKLGQSWKDFAHSLEQELVINPIQQTKTKFDLFGLENILNTYRNYGHLSAKLDPLEVREPSRYEIDLKISSIRNEDKKQIFSLPYWSKQVTLEKILQIYEHWYCNTIGYEYFYLRDDHERIWFQSIIESERYNEDLTTSQRILLLKPCPFPSQLIHINTGFPTT